MDLTKDQSNFYGQARDRCRQDVEQMNNTIRAEWQHLNDEIIGQMYASASDMLGMANDLDVSSAIKEGEDGGDDLGVGEIDL
jgi:hypothetical protein